MNLQEGVGGVSGSPKNHAHSKPFCVGIASWLFGIRSGVENNRDVEEVLSEYTTFRSHLQCQASLLEDPHGAEHATTGAIACQQQRSCSCDCGLVSHDRFTVSPCATGDPSVTPNRYSSPPLCVSSRQ